MKIKFLFSFVCFLQFVYAGPPVVKWSFGGKAPYTYKFISSDPLKTRFYTLKNGMKVILAANPKEPRITTLIPVRAGSNTDPRTNTGLAHYLEHMLFKGTDKIGVLDFTKEKPILDSIDILYEKYNKTKDENMRKAIYSNIDRLSGMASKYSIANEYDKLMKGLGAQGTNAHTWYDETVYEDNIPANAVDRFLEIEKERFRNPILRIFHTELEAVYEEKNRTLDDDNRKVFFTGMEALFPTTNYGLQTTIGTVEHLKNPSLVEIRNYYNKYYVPNNMAVIMVGDINPDEVIKKVDAAFSYMKTKPVLEYNPKPEPPLPGVIVKEVWGPTPDRVSIQYRMPGQKYPREAVLNTLCDEILSNSSAGLIDLNLNKQQKVLNAFSTIQTNKDYNVSVLGGVPKQGQTLDEVKELLLGEVKKLQNGEFDASLIQAIAANYKLNELRNVENNDAVANALSDAFIQTKGENWIHKVNRVELMKTITKKELMDFAKKYYGDKYVLIYKRKGEDKSIEKIEKPVITPVETNSSFTSDYVKQIEKKPLIPITPKWIDFSKDMTKDQVHQTDVYYVQNKTTSLYKYTLRYEMGSWHNKLLPLAAQYVQFVKLSDKSSEEISKAFYALASNYSMNVTNEVTTIQLTGLQENFTTANKLLEQILNECIADEQAWTSLKQRILKGRADAKANRQAIRQGLMQYAMYGAVNPFNNVLTDDELNAIKASDIITLLRSLTSTKHQVLYYGPRSISEFKSDLAALQRPQIYTDIPKGLSFKKISQSQKSVLYAPYEMVQAEMNWIRNTTPYDVDKTAIVNVFNYYFGAGGFTSVVPQVLRESKALAYSANAILSNPTKKDDLYTLNAYIGTQADKAKEAIAGMNDLIDNMPSIESFFTNSLSTAKNAIETERVTGEDILNRYFLLKDRGLQYDNRESMYHRIGQIDFDSLKKFQHENFANQPYTLCVVASDKRIDKSILEAYGPVKTLSLQEIFGY